MTGPITYTAPCNGCPHGLHQRIAWPTDAPGLVVSEAQPGICPGPDNGNDDYECGGRCWRLVHLRSGRVITSCLTSPEQASYIAYRLHHEVRVDWTAPRDEVLRQAKVCLEWTVMVEIIEAAGAECNIGSSAHRGPTDIDNATYPTAVPA